MPQKGSGEGEEWGGMAVHTRQAGRCELTRTMGVGPGGHSQCRN